MRTSLARTVITARRVRRLVAGLATVTAAIAGLLVAGAGPAAADAPFWVTLTANNDGLALDVQGGSTAAGAPIIQWWVNGGSNQHWHFSAPDGVDITDIFNQNSGMCLTTDGWLGNQLYQTPCDWTDDQLWYANNSSGSWSFTSVAYPWLSIDIYGYSPSPGAPVDAWYTNHAPNQVFTAW